MKCGNLLASVHGLRGSTQVANLPPEIDGHPHRARFERPADVPLFVRGIQRRQHGWGDGRLLHGLVDDLINSSRESSAYACHPKASSAQSRNLPVMAVSEDRNVQPSGSQIRGERIRLWIRPRSWMSTAHPPRRRRTSGLHPCDGILVGLYLLPGDRSDTIVSTGKLETRASGKGPNRIGWVPSRYSFPGHRPQSKARLLFRG